ncbi:MAG: GIY-YIG nuclease family protein [Bacteroidaceae bacterium]|nr:GIY-YIG nuclease family protein [Bacteroidaceae bacterium]
MSKIKDYLNTINTYNSDRQYPSGDCVYIVLCADGSLYTGWTNDFRSRMVTHNAGQGAKYTRARLPVTPVYLEYVASRSEGLRREAAIKKLSRAKKLALIESEMNEIAGGDFGLLK